MSLRSFKQYLEQLKILGIDYISTSFNNINLNKINEAFISENEDYESLEQISCPVDSIQRSDSSYDSLGLLKLKEKISNCQRCELAKKRIKLVYGEGSQASKIMLIGEGPGAEENISGRPFVGEAGKLLNNMLAAINLKREEIYITNIVKCRPPANRQPALVEIESCMPYLLQQIRIIQPKVILLMGKTAINSVLQKTDKIDDIRAMQPYSYRNIPVWVTYHPAALLRNTAWKRLAWEDLKKFRDFITENNINQ